MKFRQWSKDQFVHFLPSIFSYKLKTRRRVIIDRTSSVVRKSNGNLTRGGKKTVTYVAHGYLIVGVTSSRRRFTCRREGRRGLSLFVQLPSLDIKIASEHYPTAVHRVSASGRLPPATPRVTSLNPKTTNAIV